MFCCDGFFLRVAHICTDIHHSPDTSETAVINQRGPSVLKIDAVKLS